jgi:transcriptional regulator with XRE-family HTH domain
MGNVLDKKFSKRLNELRGDLNKAAFAEVCGINSVTMLGYLNGKSLPNLEKLRKIAEACGVTVGWLVDDETIIYKDSSKPPQIVNGNNNISAGGRISDNIFSGQTPQSGEVEHKQRMDGYLDEDELELVQMLRDIGGRRMVQRFKQELLRKQQLFDSD